MIMIGLSILCGATFFYQKYRMKKAAEDKLTNGHKEKNTVDIKTQYAEHENFDKRNVMGMGKDGLDNLQTVKLSEMSPLPLPRTESVTKTSEPKTDKSGTMSKRNPNARYSDVKITAENQ
jgi:hypothetical protein